VLLQCVDLGVSVGGEGEGKGKGKGKGKIVFLAACASLDSKNGFKDSFRAIMPE
jgi:hypothetical protein